ncbi:hypothetical protein ABW19_dt0203808 [Dactylella cylindrospora]|nr:hypothetical protein ABW19_dt0203808 [Dactylella cylindrospora]
MTVEFFATKPTSNLVVCLATRSIEKAQKAISQLKDFLDANLSSELVQRVQLHHIILDLSSIQSVTAASDVLLKRYYRIHHVFCNAAMVPFVRIDWLGAAQQIAFEFMNAFTAPNFKVQGVGWLTDANRQILIGRKGSGTANTGSRIGDSGDGLPTDLGAAFAANVFGHYYLLHEIMPLLHASPAPQDVRSRIIWIGSIESNPAAFDINDIQGIKSKLPYESSKTLIDILVLGSTIAEVDSYVQSFMKPTPTSTRGIDFEETTQPIFLLAHPGIVSTPIVAIPWWQTHAKLAAFWLCKALGSPWHCIDPYVGANAPVWAALSSHLDKVQGRKWGSGLTLRGGEIILETPVDSDVTGLSKQLWSEMERLRLLWKSRLIDMA